MNEYLKAKLFQLLTHDEMFDKKDAQIIIQWFVANEFRSRPSQNPEKIYQETNNRTRQAKCLISRDSSESLSDGLSESRPMIIR